MEIVQGKSTDQKVVIAQEIAFAKVLAGNNKTLRDRALRKLKRWLTIRGNGKRAFEESEFIRISTGLFYCMWMSDKYLVQEELAESISQLIHCFEKNSEGALLFIKCFFKRLLMEWEGLDQYRVDKFNMLVRRFLRQSLVYCKRTQWDKSILLELMKIFYQVVLHTNNCLGFVLHFISIYAEEIAKVSKGKLRHETVLTLVEPIVKLMARSKDERIQQEISYFFDHLIKQTDVGLEFEDRFNAWKQQGFPGTGPECMKREIVGKKKNVPVENENDEDFEIDDDDDDERLDEVLDPRAGSVDVFLPQIPVDPDALIALLKKYENTPHTIPLGRKKLRTWIHKLYAIKKGRFPAKFKKDLILEEKNKKRSAVKKAKKLLEFTQSLYDGPVRTKELKAISRELESYEGDEREKVLELDEDEEMDVEEDEDEEEEGEDENEDEELEEEEEEEDEEGQEEEEVEEDEEGQEEEEVEEDEEGQEEEVEEDNVDDDEEDEVEEDSEEDDKPNTQVVNKSKPENKKVVNGLKDSEQVSLENNKKAKKQKVKDNKRKCFINPYAVEAAAKMAVEGNSLPEDVLNNMKENKKQLKRAMKNHEKIIKAKIAEEVEKELRRMAKEIKSVIPEEVEPKKKRVKLVKISKEKGIGAGDKNDEGKDSSEDVSSTGEDNSQIVTPVKRRKILSSWQVQELDTNSPDYYNIKIPKTIKLEKKRREGWDTEENHEPEERNGDSEEVESSKVKEEFTPVFWEKAKAKAGKNLGKLKNKDIIVNPYALINNESKSPGLRRISFALDRNMAQENDEYLEEVRNSPKVPFDGSKKPSQSVLKSGLSPSPVNPFYRFKRIKF